MTEHWNQMIDNHSTRTLRFRISTYSTPLMVVPPPSTREDFRVVVLRDSVAPRRPAQVVRSKYIDEREHERLLEWSLREYGDLWRSLARR